MVRLWICPASSPGLLPGAGHTLLTRIEIERDNPEGMDQKLFKYDGNISSPSVPISNPMDLESPPYLSTPFVTGSSLREAFAYFGLPSR
jgi:hypothetical protein